MGKESVPGVAGVSKAESLNDFGIQPPFFSKVLHCLAAGLAIIQVLLIIPQGSIIYLIKEVPLFLNRRLFMILFFVGKGDAIPLADTSHRFRKAEIVYLHHKMVNIPPCSAPKTMKYLFFWTHHE